MNPRIITLFFVLALITFSACNDDQFAPEELAESIVKTVEPKGELSDNVIPGEYILMFKPASIAPIFPDSNSTKSFKDRAEKAAFVDAKYPQVVDQINDLLQANNILPEQVMHYYTSFAAGVGIKLSNDEFERIRKIEAIEGVEYNREAPVPEVKLSSDSTINNLRSSQYVSCSINAAGGYARKSDDKRWIWIVDSGIDLDHPDLNVVTNPKYAASFADYTPDDCNGHGTHVAGIAAAINNGYGVVGVAAGAPVVPVKVFGCSNSSSTATIIAGIDHVGKYSYRGDVTNMSLGGYFGYGCSKFTPYRRTVLGLGNSGVWIAIAAGNDSQDANYFAPGCLSGKRIYTVGSITCNGYWSSFSNYGRGPIDYVAVGSQVYSTYLRGKYKVLDGTSMAAPVIAGIMHYRNGAPRKGSSFYFGGAAYPLGRIQ